MLKPETERIWEFLRIQPGLSGFVLLGGSALALHLGHRLSEDLDFGFPEERLPRHRLDALVRLAAAAGIDLQPQDDPAALHEFTDAGLDLHDYQQNLLAAGIVKLSFFALEPGFRAVLASPPAGQCPRMAALEELFRTKCLLTARRNRLRDWFDLYVLFNRQGFSMKDYHEAFAAAGMRDQASAGLQRICLGKPVLRDEGFAHLAPTAPSLEEMQACFIKLRDDFERSEAAEAWRQRLK